jgi:hypothetical protein
MANRVVKVRIEDGGKYVATVVPRDDEGRKQGPADVNVNPLARRAADVGVEALGLNAYAREIFRWNQRFTPSATCVAETAEEARQLGRRVDRRIGSNNGRKAPIVDVVIGNVGINVKFTSSKDHKYVTLTTPKDTGIEDAVADLAAAPVCVLLIHCDDVQTDSGLHYVLDRARVRWLVVDASQAIRDTGGTFAALAAAKKGRGAPKKGEAPRAPAWATHADTEAINGSWKINVRTPAFGTGAWREGSLSELQAELAQLGKG